MFIVFLSAPHVPVDKEWWTPENEDGAVLMRAPLSDGETVWLLRERHELTPEDRIELEKRRIETMTRIVPVAVAQGADAVVGRTLVPGLQADPELGTAMFVELVQHWFRDEGVARDWFAFTQRNSLPGSVERG